VAITNIVGNGHDVYYDENLDASKWLEGKTFALAGGGRLIATKEDRLSLLTSVTFRRNVRGS
jgi:hypothetical protein